MAKRPQWQENKRSAFTRGRMCGACEGRRPFQTMRPIEHKPYCALSITVEGGRTLVRRLRTPDPVPVLPARPFSR